MSELNLSPVHVFQKGQNVQLLPDEALFSEALTAQQMLKDSGIGLFGNAEYSGHSPDMNVTGMRHWSYPERLS